MNKLANTSIQYIKGVGPKRKILFGNLGVDNIEDLFYLFPRRYEDRSRMVELKNVRAGECQVVAGDVLRQSARRSYYKRKHVHEIVVTDGSGQITAVWFNQPYLAHYFKVGSRVVLYGKAEVYKNRLQMISPEYEIIDRGDEKLNMGRIVPIYPLTRGMTQRYLRKIIAAGLDEYLDELEDVLPVWLRNKHRLPNIRRSIQNLHFPENAQEQEEALRRMSFEEFFLFQISVICRRMSIVRRPGVEHAVSGQMVEEFKEQLPFTLTAAQRRVIHEISADMQKTSPMLRLLQGDVGSGKTVVALFGCVTAFRNGRQAAVMAPTEVLARQHFESIQRMIADGPLSSMRVNLLVGSMPKAEHERVSSQLARGEIDLVIGTHALLSEGVTIPRLSFAVIDEQHKFGVRQRALLSSKGQCPDVLVMTATPIPRTLSLTLFGDLDVSVIDELPPGRGDVETLVFPMDEAQGVYGKVKEILRQGEQAYIIYPLVEESEALDLKAAETMYKEFRTKIFKEFRIGLVHGQMKNSEAENVMSKFKRHELDLLVATTVLEVGIDVPNANVMVIEHAERFGLSQLHQLRGRIGRGGKNGVCFLIADPTTESGLSRLEAIVSTRNGFEIAQKDLEIRGPGQYFGRHQHGLNELRFSDPMRQIDILELARKEAEETVHKDLHLIEPQNAGLKAVIAERFPGFLENVEAG
ncbi:MAG TPA: ATP-dependent DNA helicase RecG [Candidatus Omnitrophota bacterium]|nr:ATP-dependent DNA helicase RecG [Candidatus Omnitrophota bacterium]